MTEIEDFLSDEPQKQKPEPQINQEIKNRLWKLNDTEYSNLEQSIIKDGCRESIILWNNTIIDGHNRYEICKKHHIEYKTITKQFDNLTQVLKWVDTNQLSRRNLTDEQRTILLGRISKTFKVDKQENLKIGPKGQNVSSGINQQTAAKELGVSTKTLQRSEDYLEATEIIEKNVGKETIDKIISREVIIPKQDLIKISKQKPEEQIKTIKRIENKEVKSLKDANRQIIKETLEKKSLEIKDKYRIIYADPPWKYNDKLTEDYGAAENHYITMSIKELCDMKVKEITEDDAVLFLWTTSPFLEESFKVINSWGFKYKSSFVWDKVKHNMGHYNSVRHELLLIATKGSCVPDNRKLYDSVQTIERSDKHSEKPEEFRNIIETLYTFGKKIELFSRTKKEGWETYGNE